MRNVFSVRVEQNKDFPVVGVDAKLVDDFKRVFAPVLNVEMLTQV